MTSTADRAVVEAVMDCVAARAAGHREQAMEALGRVLASDNVLDWFPAMCAIAEIVKQLGGLNDCGPGEYYGLEVDGPEPVDDSPPAPLAAMRFITAHVNGDTDLALAIFHALCTSGDPSSMSEVIVCLVDAAGAVVRNPQSTAGR